MKALRQNTRAGCNAPARQHSRKYVGDGPAWGRAPVLKQSRACWCANGLRHAPRAGRVLQKVSMHAGAMRREGAARHWDTLVHGCGRGASKQAPGARQPSLHHGAAHAAREARQKARGRGRGLRTTETGGGAARPRRAAPAARRGAGAPKACKCGSRLRVHVLGGGAARLGRLERGDARRAAAGDEDVDVIGACGWRRVTTGDPGVCLRVHA